jgi:hypothetical protein
MTFELYFIRSITVKKGATFEKVDEKIDEKNYIGEKIICETSGKLMVYIKKYTVARISLLMIMQ